MKYLFSTTLLLCVISSFAQINIKLPDGTEYVYFQEEVELDEHPNLNLRIDSIDIAGEKFEVNFEYSGIIKKQTDLLQINDSLAINVIFFKLIINNKNEYFSSTNFYKKDNDQNWKEIGWYTFYKYSTGSHVAGWGGFGHRGQPDSFFYKMYMTFE